VHPFRRHIITGGYCSGKFIPSSTSIAKDDNRTFQMYRLWITYLKRASVMWFPFILWLGGIACVGMQTFLQIKNIHDPNFGPYRWSKVNMNVGPGIVVTPFLASTIVLNAYCTGEFLRCKGKNANDKQRTVMHLFCQVS
jgi:hypothetical protein